MNQTQLDSDAKHMARTTDPVTSHLAAEQVTASGVAKAQRELCLAAVKELPGSTSAELAAAIDCERHIPARRLPELRDKGLVKNGAIRVCRITGSQCLTWWPI